MSYNVRHGISMDGNPSMDAQAGIINQQSPHWLGLQEIDHFCQRSGSIDQTKKYGKLTGMQGYFGKFMDFDSGEYGMAVLSNLPVEKTKILKLPAGAEPRVAIIQTLLLPNTLKIALVNVHFDWTKPAYRLPQAETLINYLEDLQLPTIILGDYNAKPGSPTLDFFQKSGFHPVQKSDSTLTWPADNPRVEIDHVFIRNTPQVRITPKHIMVLDEPTASDHRPVVAQLVIEQR